MPRSNRTARTRRILALILAPLSLLASLGFTAGAAAAQSKGGGGGPKATTTTAPTNGSSTTTPTSTGGGGGGGGVANPKLTAITSLSRHRVLATYDRDLDAAALEASSYAFYSTQAVNLPVLGVSRATNNQAFVLTEAQEPVSYTVKLPKTSRPITFTGSSATEPKVVSANPISTTQIIVTFSEPVGPSALQPSAYQLTVQGSTSTLAVTGASFFGQNQTQVLLTTAPQQQVTYVLVVGDIQATSGTYIDPTGNSQPVSGSTVTAGPMLLTANSAGDTTLVLTFDAPLDPASATNVANYTTTPNLFIEKAVLQAENKQVVLTTGPQYQGTYSIVANVKGANGSTVNPNFNSASFSGSVAVNNERPKVVSAGSTGNKSVTVQFSKPMSDDAIDPSHYAIVQVVVHPEVGALGVDAAKFVGTDRLSVQLTTKSQAEVTYQVSAHNVTDMAGNPLADKTNVAGVIVDPTSWTFAGTPPTGDERTNSDTDTLWDHEETRGWQITIKLGNGDTQVRQVTSSLSTDDTDGDGLKDHEERALNIDPRDDDTDDDGLTDWMEFNEFYSDPADQDSDADTLFDGLEVSTFRTSPIFDDTDGDQLKDGYEINVNRNPKVADLPQPILTLGDMRLGLDVKFTESNGETTRDLDSRTVESTLTQSQSQEFSRSEGTTIEVATTTAASQQYEHGWKVAGLIGLGSGVERKLTFGFSQETANTNSFSSTFTATSAESTEQAYTNSLSTEAEVSKDSNVTRDVFGARVQLGVFLEGRGNVAFTVRNLQVTALIQDPNDPTRLTPITTLTPDLEPATGFNLGPLVPAKGPIVFTSTDVSPELVEELMRNPQGIVFRFSNYDVVDEAGRNFAFTSQDINDRTARIAIDYGGYDPNGDGRGEETEILRVATGVIGRHVEDTDGDGDVDTADRRVIFDLQGKPVGITMRDAMEAAGLTWYDEDANPSSGLTRDLKQKSFSTKKLPGPDGEFEIIYRIREREIRLDSPKEWLIVTSTGVDPFIRLDDRILYPGSNVNLSFVADEDNDRLPAISEALHGCIDDPQLVGGKHPSRDTDGDGLDDRFEVLVGWDVETPQSHGRVRSQCNAKDSDRDGVSDRDEAPASITYDAAGLVVFDDRVSDIRLVSDLKTTNGSAVVTSPSANFTIFDVGVSIEGLGIPDGAKIASVQSPTQATMTASATATAGRAQIGARLVFDLRTTSDSPVITSGSANLTANDVDATITGPGIPDGTKIASVQSPSQATMTANATDTSFAAEIGALYTAANDPRRDVVGYEPRSVTDLVTTSGSPTVTSASAAFTSQDIGRPISGAGIPVASSILSVESATQATMTANATATASGVAATIAGFASRSVSDLVTTEGSDVVTSASARFTSRDEGVTIRGTGIPDSTTILSVQSPTQATMTAKASAAGTSVAAGIGQSPVDRPLYDPVTDPMGPDTDGDGLSDRFELTKYKNALTKPERRTSPEHHDSDVDQLTDGVERKLGADPRFDDRAEFWDSDRDGLTDAQEVADDNFDFMIDGSEIKAGAGWEVRLTLMHPRSATPNLAGVCPNATCPAQVVSGARRVYSSKYDPDTDDDGLTDFEEFKLGTDPGCAPAIPSGILDCEPDDPDKDSDGDGVRDGWDSDRDGLTDFQEVRGFKLADGSTVKTKPTNVDTDNDKRTDGEEAGLPGGELIVRLPGGEVYPAQSNPTRADTDFDQLVDGDEQTYGIDPTLPNTDKDNRTDYSEVLAGRRPEVPDMLVKMEFVRLFVEQDAEGAGDSGDFRFEFSVVKPDTTTTVVVDSVPPPVAPAVESGPAPLPLPFCPDPDKNEHSQCFRTINGITVVKVLDGQSVPFGPNGQGRTIDIGSVSTIDAVPESFGVRGWIEERDNADHTKLSCRVEIFPDIFGNFEDGTGLLRGSDMRLGEQSMAISRSVTNCLEEPNLKFTLMVSYTAQ